MVSAATFSNMGLSESEAMGHFDSIFGAAGIGHEQKYYDGMAELKTSKNNPDVDFRKYIGQKLIEKGLITKAPSISSTTGGTFTGYGLLPPFVDPSIVDRTVRETPLVRLLARRAVRGRSYVYNIRSAKAGADWVTEDGSLAEQVDTYALTNVTMSVLAAIGRVTDLAGASETIINLMAEEIKTKTASMNEALENEIINGNTTTDALGFNGLLAALTTNVPDSTGAAINIDNLRTDMNTAFEANALVDLVVTDGSTFNTIKGLLMDFQRNVEQPAALMEFGIPDAFMFDGALFVKDRYMPTTAANRQILYLDTRYLYLAVLRDYTFEELAKTNLSRKFVLSWFGSLAVTFEAGMVRRDNLA